MMPRPLSLALPPYPSLHTETSSYFLHQLVFTALTRTPPPPAKLTKDYILTAAIATNLHGVARLASRETGQPEVCEDYPRWVEGWRGGDEVVVAGDGASCARVCVRV